MEYVNAYPDHGKPFFPDNKIEVVYGAIMDAVNYMKKEIDETIAANDSGKIELLIIQLKKKVEDQRIYDFFNYAGHMIDQYNIAYEDGRIPPNKLYYYFKDGFIVTSYFKDRVYKVLDKYNKGILKPDKFGEQEGGSAETGERLRVNLSVKELLYLFKALRDIGVLKNTNNTDIFNVISNSFQLTSTSDVKKLSVKHLQNTWSQLDVATARTWFDKFAELSNKAKLDNPNQIKGKG